MGNSCLDWMLKVQTHLQSQQGMMGWQRQGGETAIDQTDNSDISLDEYLFTNDFGSLLIKLQFYMFVCINTKLALKNAYFYGGNIDGRKQKMV